MDYKIVLDAGHGGADSGATGNGIIEKDLNLKITEYLYDRLKELGIPVKVTRDSDETLTPDERVKRVLNAFGNDDNVIVISNHINAGAGDGAEVIYPLRSNGILANLILNEISKEGQNIRRAYQRRLPSDYSKDYYFMQRNTGDTEALTVEYGFLDSTKDDVYQLKNNYKRYAEAVLRALLDYIGYDNSGDTGFYEVKKGDTLYSIAIKYNTTVSELKEINNLSNNILTIGEKLIIPEKTIQENIYIVEKGDTLYSIARRFNTSIDTLKSLNNLTNDILSVGQVLILKPVDEEEGYVVVSGDTLYSIAKKFNTDVNTLKLLNNLSNNMISIGQKLKIPNSISVDEEIEYIVKKGDTLYSIAKMFGKTVDELKDINNIATDLISIGEKLIV